MPVAESYCLLKSCTFVLRYIKENKQTSAERSARELNTDRVAEVGFGCTRSKSKTCTNVKKNYQLPAQLLVRTEVRISKFFQQTGDADVAKSILCRFCETACLFLSTFRSYWAEELIPPDPPVIGSSCSRGQAATAKFCSAANAFNWRKVA